MTGLLDKMDCPAPKFDFEVITMGHGSGGVLMHRLLDGGVFRMLSNEYLDEAHDGAFLQLHGATAFSTDSFVIDPIFFPGGNIGELAVNGTVNDVAMCGAVPKYLSLSFILEEGLLIKDFEQVLLGVQRACLEAGVQVVTGDTKVVERGKGDQVFINTTGIGSLHPKAKIGVANVREGDQVIVSGNIATHGIAILSVRKGLTFETALESDTTNLNHLTLRLIEELGDAVRFFRDPTRGGLAASLNELAQGARLGVQLQQRQIPMEEAVEGASEMLGLDPLYVANEGIFVAVVAPEQTGRALELLRADEKGKNAAVIGTIVAEHPGKVVLESSIGGRRVVHLPAGELLPRIC
jgi:hydrogenase expression/formation protein HypE